MSSSASLREAPTVASGTVSLFSGVVTVPVILPSGHNLPNLAYKPTLTRPTPKRTASPGTVPVLHAASHRSLPPTPPQPASRRSGHSRTRDGPRSLASASPAARKWMITARLVATAAGRAQQRYHGSVATAATCVSARPHPPSAALRALRPGVAELLRRTESLRL